MCLCTFTTGLPATAQFTTIINVPEDQPTISGQLGSDTQLNLSDGGWIGGTLRAGNSDGSSSNIELNLNGGYSESPIYLYNNSSANITAGDFSIITAYTSSSIDISGGSVNGSLVIQNGSSANISGGYVPILAAQVGSSVNLHASQFYIDGELVTGLDTIGDITSLNVPNDSRLAVLFSDGNISHFYKAGASSIADDTLTLTRTASPTYSPVINLPADPAPQNAYPGQIVNINDGGALGYRFYALDAQINLDGGSIDERFTADAGTVVTINSGELGRNATFYENTTLNLNGGQVNANFTAGAGSTINLNDGYIASNFEALPGSTLNIAGGDINNNAAAHEGSTVNFIGSRFYIAGQPVTGLQNVGDSMAIDLSGYNAKGITAILADGSVEQFNNMQSSFQAPLANFNVVLSEPLNAPSVINIPNDPAPKGLYPGQTLNLYDGGSLSGIHMVESTMNIHGGYVASLLSAEIDSTVNITGGEVVRLTAAYRTTVNISDANVHYVDASGDGTSVTISSGEFTSIEARSGSLIDISGGDIGSITGESGTPDTVFNLRGGHISGEIEGHSSSVFNIYGGEFYYNGLPVQGLDNIGDSVTLDLYNNQLVATLSDGTIRAFGYYHNDKLQSSTVTIVKADVPAADTTPINVPAEPAPNGLRPGQTLNLSGGETLPRYFTLAGATLNIEDGNTNYNLIAQAGSTINFENGTIDTGSYLTQNSTLNMTGGIVERQFRIINSTFNFHGGTIRSGDPPPTPGCYTCSVTGASANDSVINITGGEVGGYFLAYSNNQINVSGGYIRGGFTLYGENNQLNITGGTFKDELIVDQTNSANISGGVLDSLCVYDGGTVHLSGGQVKRGVQVSTDGNFHYSGGNISSALIAETGSNVQISAEAFYLDGIPVAGLVAPGDSAPLNIPVGSHLTMLFSDGTAHMLDASKNDSIADGSLTLNLLTPTTHNYTFNVPTDTAPSGIGPGSTLNLYDGGVLAENFLAFGANVNITGGEVEDNFYADGASTVNISGGTVYGNMTAFSGSTLNVYNDARLLDATANSQSVVNVFGGQLGTIQTGQGVTINIHDGVVGPITNLAEDSVVNITGGLIGSLFEGSITALSSNTVNILGGVFQSVVGADNTMNAYAGSTINIIGTSFTLDGVDLTDSMIPGEKLTITDRDVLLQGILADGSTFYFLINSEEVTVPNMVFGQYYGGGHYIDPDATLTIALVPEPATLLLLSAGALSLLHRQRLS